MAQGPWLEAVPNVSLGRSEAAVRRVTRGLGGALLDVHQDRDHDRTVLTFFAPEGELAAALFAAFDEALGEIDLARNKGVHPKVGAVDVVPFVPVDGATMDQAIHAARRFAQAFARRYEIPVFLYGAASPQGRSLPRIRRGGLPGLTRRMRDSEAWVPDHGPPAPHPRWGVTVVGARDVLVAYNVDMPAEERTRARELARRLRTSSGGRPALQALGLDLRSPRRAQLSMNFLDHGTTCPSDVLAELTEGGEPITRSELVGLLPEAVLARAGARALRLDEDFDPGRHLLEPRLRLRRARADFQALEEELSPPLRRRLRAILARALGVPPGELR